MALAKWQSTVVDDAGNVKAGASVRVEVYTGEASYTLATIKPNRDGSGSLGNPFNANDDGFAEFYADVGRYRITATYAGAQRIWEHIILLADASLPLAAGGTVTWTMADGDNDDPTIPGFSAATAVLLLETGAGTDCNITSLPVTTDGHEVLLVANHANGADIKVEDSGATAGQRIFGAFNQSLLQRMAVKVRYVSALSRWVLQP
jgi:hypothetical protein